jgi:hypothetical protein
MSTFDTSDPSMRRYLGNHEQMQRKIKDGKGEPFNDDEIALLTKLGQETKDEYAQTRDVLARESERDLAAEAAAIAKSKDTGRDIYPKESASEFVWRMVERNLFELQTQMRDKGYSEEDYLAHLYYWGHNYGKAGQDEVDFLEPKDKTLEKYKQKISSLEAKGISGEQKITQWLIGDVYGYRDPERSISKIQNMAQELGLKLARENLRNAA